MTLCQNDDLATTLATNDEIMMLAPRFATVVDAQQTFSKLLIMTHEFWALMSAGSAIFLASQIAIYFAMVIWIINMLFGISYIWCVTSECKPLDILNVSEYD